MRVDFITTIGGSPAAGKELFFWVFFAFLRAERQRSEAFLLVFSFERSEEAFLLFFSSERSEEAFLSSFLGVFFRDKRSEEEKLTRNEKLQKLQKQGEARRRPHPPGPWRRGPGQLPARRGLYRRAVRVLLDPAVVHGTC